MSGFKVYFFLLIVCTFTELYQCGRYGGGGSRGGGGGSRGGGGGSRSGGGSRPSYGWRPSPSPSPSYHPSYHPSPSPSYPSYRPSPTHRPSPRPPSNRPTSPRPPPVHPPAYPSTARPYGGRPTSRPGPTPPPTSRSGSTRRPPTTPSHYVGSTKSPVWGGLPPRPGSKGYKPEGPPVNQHITYKIKNKYYSYPGQYSLPMPSPHVGYYYTPSYHYTSHDTGSTALGFFLGYSLGHLTTPTYSHYSFYDGYRPRYDHYTVHHYYHNRESVPQQQEIRSNNIVGCVAESANVCPGNTVSLCTSTGTLMCVVNAASTVPCENNGQLNCARTTISCVNNTAEECKNSKTATISVPCVSTAKVYGEIKTENNTIVTLNNTANTNLTSPATTDVANTTITAAVEYSTKYPITTTPLPLAEQATTNVTTRKKRDVVPQNFCVTVLAVPAEKPPTEGEKVFNNAKEILSDFWERAWGV